MSRLSGSRAYVPMSLLHVRLAKGSFLVMQSHGVLYILLRICIATMLTSADFLYHTQLVLKILEAAFWCTLHLNQYIPRCRTNAIRAAAWLPQVRET